MEQACQRAILIIPPKLIAASTNDHRGIKATPREREKAAVAE